MTIDPQGYELIDAQPVVKDWEWWSDFLQREYYGSPDELDAWRQTAAGVVRDLALVPGMRVLDLGSGCGELAMQLASRGMIVTGVEHSRPLVSHCARLARDRGIDVGFVAADMFTFEPERAVDVVLSVNTSFGYGDDAANRDLVARIATWLAPGGAFYCDVISADSAEAFGTWNDVVAGGRLIVDNSYEPVKHIMTSWPSWLTPDERTIYTVEAPEIVRLYMRSAMEEMMQAASLTPSRLMRAMGRRFPQDDRQMLTTWIARRD